MSNHFFHSISSLSVIALLNACAILPPGPAAVSVESSIDASSTVSIADAPRVTNTAIATAMNQLAMANQWHREGDYARALNAYEGILVDKASVLSETYALLGLIALGLDRDNPAYSRATANDTLHVLHQRIENAAMTDAANEARMLSLTASLLITADMNKDQVMLKNGQLLDELAQRDEAIKRLRELTLGN